jgi:excisionase family DNA binding protein|tara:strand:- start:237 stop:416 length:180 start_codon:yes stop_codon:yes gene_type:complete
MNNNLLTVAQVAKKLSVDKQMVYQLIKDGLLKSIRLGYKTIRVAPDDLKQFVEQHSVTA